MKQAASPNFNARAPGVALDYIILHYTGMQDAVSALARMCDPAAQVSAHYMIDEDGSLTQLVDEKNRAWHAGRSLWRGITDINSASIGIELVNPGHEFGYRPFPDAQIAALKTVMHDIIARHKMSPAQAPLAHSDIAPARKEDPGELFPWQNLAQDGLGLWPVATTGIISADNDAVYLLNAIGYDTTEPAKALLAFQRRYRPALLTGSADPETLALLHALKALLKD